jgi:Transposase, Mutator family
VVSLYAKGMTTGDIAAHLKEVYDTTISRDLVSTVTEKVTKEMRGVAGSTEPMPAYTEIPTVPISGSQAVSVVITACRCRRIV